MKARRRRLSSLRSRVYLVVMVVALLPIVLVLVARVTDAIEGNGLRAAAAEAAAAAAIPAARGALDPATLDAIASGHLVRLRVFAADGTVVTSRNEDRRQSLRHDLGDLFFGPQGVPTLETSDASSSPQREIDEARRVGRAEACVVELGGRLLICRAAVAAGGGVVVAEKSAARAIRSFYDARYPLLKLTLYVAAVGLVLAAWLGRRMVKPIEDLRREVSKRIDAPDDAAPIPVREGDELGDLADAYNALLRSLATRGRANEAFAADLAHELKSPVAAVRAAAEALGDGRAVDAERAARLGRALGRSSARLDALVTRFLDLARVEAGLPDERRAPVDLAALARGLGGAIADEDHFGGVHVEVDAPVPVVVVGIASRIESALRNVIENAASFAGERKRVRVAVTADDGVAIVEVHDGGPGIAEDKLPRVFDRFFSERRDERGTGLGLALAKAVVEAHGGDIAATSRPGEGATFTLRIPAVSHQIHTTSGDDSPAA